MFKILHQTTMTATLTDRLSGTGEMRIMHLGRTICSLAGFRGKNTDVHTHTHTMHTTKNVSASIKKNYIYGTGPPNTWVVHRVFR